MNKNERKTCKFHFILDSEMQKNLEDTLLYRKLGNFSQLVDIVLKMLSPHIEEKHLKNEQMASQYELVHTDLAVERKGVFVYLTGYRYRQLKLMHQDLNFIHHKPLQLEIQPNS